MLAIPIKELGENPSVSDYFGRSKWFALIENDIMSFEKNKNKSGCSTVEWLNALGVTEAVITHIGPKPLHKLYDMNIKCLYSEKTLSSLQDVFETLDKKAFGKLSIENEKDVVDHIHGCNENCD